jgi:predicted GNAT family acetyltransferase
MNKDIIHIPARNRFEVHTDGFVGFLEYDKSADSINYTHTIIPKELGGRGLGTELVKYALAYARVEHLKVIPSCSFVAALMDEHSVYHDLRMD